ncbi:hypothetical protein [Psychrobacillus sp. FJAT-21963]|uniref:hypothetical protein n=1 Tax=Psychrobacillus sp. FJAT-21963 TaxID=1712028 RepID=UPI000701F353|nr:hypothetical protein [Psychrobacillus sp. FJAT-21963]KQL33349.1 hypothetical protein AN959_17470 [Psychrobacillus sp. FJAT-21963]
MNHIDLLVKLKSEELNQILDTLKIDNFDFQDLWKAKLIAEEYTSDRKFQRVIQEIDNQTITDLLFYVNVDKPLKEEQVKILSNYGIIVNKILPSYLKESLQNWSRSYFVKEFPDKKESVQHTQFLKMVFVLGYFERRIEIKLNWNRKKDKNVRIASEETRVIKEDFKKLIGYLVDCGIVNKSNHVYRLNHQVYRKWRQESIYTNLFNFYTDVADQRVFELMSKISRYQREAHEWVDTSIIIDTSIEYDLTKQLGLIYVHKENGRSFVQLSPEGWYLIKKEFHPLWNEKLLIISADYEVFIPFYYEPFILFDLLPFCEIEDSNYFIVLRISNVEEKRKSDDLVFFYETIKSRASHIPDVVKYDYEVLFHHESFEGSV